MIRPSFKIFPNTRAYTVSEIRFVEREEMKPDIGSGEDDISGADVSISEGQLVGNRLVAVSP